jgi:hypothetical protein
VPADSAAEALQGCRHFVIGAGKISTRARKFERLAQSAASHFVPAGAVVHARGETVNSTAKRVECSTCSLWYDSDLACHSPRFDPTMGLGELAPRVGLLDDGPDLTALDQLG